jgi:beta-galactosidase
MSLMVSFLFHIYSKWRITNRIIIIKLQNNFQIFHFAFFKHWGLIGSATPILDKISMDESLLHRKKGETLNLTKETPDQAGTFTAGNG